MDSGIAAKGPTSQGNAKNPHPEKSPMLVEWNGGPNFFYSTISHPGLLALGSLSAKATPEAALDTLCDSPVS